MTDSQPSRQDSGGQSATSTDRPIGHEDIKTGERYAKSELTGQWYRVTAWVERGETKIVAVEKDEVEKPPHADDERVHCPGGDSDGE